MKRLPLLLIGLLIPLLSIAKPARTFSDSSYLDRLHSARLALILLENNYNDQIIYLLSHPTERFVLTTRINPDNLFDLCKVTYPKNRELFDSTLASDCFKYINDMINQLDTVICYLPFTAEFIDAGKDYLLEDLKCIMPFNSMWFQYAWARRDSANDKRSPSFYSIGLTA